MNRINHSDDRRLPTNSVEPGSQETLPHAATHEQPIDRFEQWRLRWNRSGHDIHDRLEALEDLLDALNDEQHATPSASLEASSF